MPPEDCVSFKTSEDGNVSGIEFTITGEDYSERVRTGSDGTIDVTGLMPAGTPSPR